MTGVGRNGEGQAQVREAGHRVQWRVLGAGLAVGVCAWGSWCWRAASWWCVFVPAGRGQGEACKQSVLERRASRCCRPLPELPPQGYSWAEDKEHCEEYGRMLNADPTKVSQRAKKRGLPQVGGRVDGWVWGWQRSFTGTGELAGRPGGAAPAACLRAPAAQCAGVRELPSRRCKRQLSLWVHCTATADWVPMMKLAHPQLAYPTPLTYPPVHPLALACAADGHAGRGKPLRGDPGGGRGV